MRRALPTVGPVERALYLRSLPLFHELPPVDLAACAQLLDEVMVRRHTILYGPHQGVPAVYLLVDGTVQAESAGRTVAVARAPGLAGLVEFLAGDQPIPRVVAATNVLALALDAAALLDLLEDHFAIFMQARRFIGAQLARLQSELKDDASAAPVPHPGLPGPVKELDPARRLWLVQQAPVFHGIGLGVLAALLRDEREIRLSPGEHAWEEGSDADFMCVIARGSVRCTAEGARQSFQIGAGGTLGAEAAFGGMPHSHTAVAEDEVTALRIDTQLLLDLAEDNFDLGLRTLSHLAREILRLQEHLAATEKNT